ncbi:hypothetical protein HYR99_35595, partial [Candidatus Poribacteria bacterium]|nr:hypothetical protein [Candidatus Poribacteria bacterium]
MKVKSIITHCFRLLFVCSILVAVNGYAQNTQNTAEPVPKGEEKFDLNSDGKLSEGEKEVMLNAIAIETFTGKTLTVEEIREMGRERGFGGGGPGGFGFGGRGGPRQSEAIASR